MEPTQKSIVQLTKAGVKPPARPPPPNLVSAIRPRAFMPSSMRISSPSTVPSAQQIMMHSTSLVPTALTTPIANVARPIAASRASVYLFFIRPPQARPIPPPTITAAAFTIAPSIVIPPASVSLPKNIAAAQIIQPTARRCKLASCTNPGRVPRLPMRDFALGGWAALAAR